MSRQSPCRWIQSQHLVPYTLPWKDSQDYSYSTGWLIQLLLFCLFLKATGSKHFSSSFLTSTEIMVWHPLPLLLMLAWHCSLMAHSTCSHAASGLSSSGLHAEKGTTNSVLVEHSARTALMQHNRVSCPWRPLPLHTRVGLHPAPVSGSQTSALTVKSQSLLEHRQIPAWVTAAQFHAIILSVRHLCSWLQIAVSPFYAAKQFLCSKLLDFSSSGGTFRWIQPL